ncbi:GNAT family N-acetyltransferase [Rhodococcus sp. NPDC058521]|uniref:GNAT family N-acetyltransferase n=1 Tax=Rhodococcus sp. NPDC058521 TaxID=3346536 RepID=UPI003650BE80
MTAFLPVTTDRLVLRPYVSSDRAEFHAVYSRPEVARFLLEEPWTEHVAEQKVAERSEQTCLNGPGGTLALVVDLEGRAIGNVMLWFTDREHGVAEIGWVLDPTFGGRGYGAEAVRAVLNLAFDHYRIHRVAAQMDGRNTASARLAKNVGMRHEAHLRQDWWSKGEWTDTVIFGTLASDR